MSLLPCARAQLIFSRLLHTVRTATVRDELVGWVVSGRKRLATPFGETRFAPGQVFVMPRSTQWDMINEPAPGGHYEARLMGFAPQLVERFHERFGQFAGIAAVQSCASSVADEAFVATFGHARPIIRTSQMTE